MTIFEILFNETKEFLKYSSSIDFLKNTIFSVISPYPILSPGLVECFIEHSFLVFFTKPLTFSKPPFQLKFSFLILLSLGLVTEK